LSPVWSKEGFQPIFCFYEKAIVNTASSIQEHLDDSNVLETIDSFTFNQKKQECNKEIDSYDKRDNSLPKGAMTVGEYLRSKNGN
jgi:hypothetical protein